MAGKLIFTKDAGVGTLIRICEDETDLNQSNVTLENYKVYDVSDDDLLALKLGTKAAIGHDGNTVTYSDDTPGWTNEEGLQMYIANFVNQIDDFLNNNSGHPQYDKWNNYKTQLNNFDTSSLSYPHTGSLQKHFSDNSQPFYHHSQLV